VSPTGANLTGGSFAIRYARNSVPNTMTASISPSSGTQAHTQSNSTFRFSQLPQGNYTVTVTDPLYGPECKVTLQKTLRVGGYFTDSSMGKGSMYCNFQGYPGGTDAPPCPLDPVDPQDAADPDYVAPSPPGGWTELNFNSSTNLRKCKYPFTCNSPDSVVVYEAPDGDGQTPSCIRAITTCPNTDPPSNPAPWIRISRPGDPLVCKLNPDIFPPINTGIGCTYFGFNPLTPSELALPDVATWLVTTATSKHIICY